MRIEALSPLRINRPDGESLHLKPGHPIDVPDELGARILQRLPDKVRVAEPTCIEPATQNARPIYWESGDGRILAATPEFLVKSGEQFWIVTTFEGQIRWINADQLRSRKTFEKQAAVQEIELVRF